MRKPIYAATVVAAAILGGGIAAAPAQAETGKEMKVCWTSPAGTNYGIKVVLDGPSSRSKWLANGDCKSWNVRPGEYKVIWANSDELFRSVYYYYNDYSSYEEYVSRVEAVCGPMPENHYANISPMAYVKRFRNDYVTYAYDGGNTGVVRTTVQKDRLTKVNFRMRCEFFPNND